MAQTRQTTPRLGSRPDPAGAETVEALAVELRRLRAWSGLSFRDLHRRLTELRQSRGVVEIPTLTTVHRSMQPGRRRLDLELVTDIATVLLGDESAAKEWRAACQRVMGVESDASLVAVADRFPERDDLVGRDAELAALLGPGSPVRPGVPIIVEGMAGIGKTALAARVAEELADRQHIATRLSVELRGYEPGRAPVDPGALIAALLNRLGMGGHRIHGLSVPARAAHLRHLTADRGAVILLDDVSDVDQVRPLVGDEAAYFLLVTSRQRLDVPGAVRVTLDELDDAAVLDYLTRLTGPERVAAEPDAAAAAVQLVGRLPLAIGLLGSRIAAYPDWTIADQVERLRDRHDKLQLESGIELALATTYAVLSDDLRRALRLVGLHPGKRLDAYITAALLDTDLETAHHRLDELAAHHLVQPSGPDGFELHDLIRLFAANQAHDQEAPASRRAALTRLLDMYGAAAIEAAKRWDPASRFPSVAVATPVPAFTERQDAADWLESRRIDLLAAADLAADNRWSAQLGALSAALSDFLLDTARYREAAALHRKATRQGTALGRAQAARRLGIALVRLARYDDATVMLERARSGARAVGDRELESRALHMLGWVAIHQHDNEMALRRAEEALILADEADSPSARARALRLRGDAQAELGRLDEAEKSVRAAIAAIPEEADPIMHRVFKNTLARLRFDQGDFVASLRMFDELLIEHQRAGERGHVALTLNNLGDVHEQLGNNRKAVGCYRRSIVLAAELEYSDREAEAANDLGCLLRRLAHPAFARSAYERALGVADDLDIRFERARAHEGLAEIAYESGDRDEAIAGWRRSLREYRELGVPEAEKLAERLQDLGVAVD